MRVNEYLAENGLNLNRGMIVDASIIDAPSSTKNRVLPIENPVHVAAKWILCGESWRMVAEDAKKVVSK